MTKHVHLLLMMAGGVAAALVIAFVGSAGDAGAAPSLVVNGNFDTDAASWNAAVSSAITRTAGQDADANASSGAGTVAWTASGAGDGIASQCVILSGAGNYQLSASYKLAAGGSGTQTASVDATVYTDNACSAGAVAHTSGPLSPNGSWQTYSPGAIVVTTELSIKVDLITHATAQNDAVYFDKIALSNGPLDTPTATNTPTSTNTVLPTNTPLPATSTATSTSTATVTNTATPTATSTLPATRTNTPVVTSTPIPPTDTPVPPPTDTPVQAAPPEAPVDVAPPPSDGTNPVAADTTGTGDQGGADVVPAEGSAGAEGFPDSGYGPQGRSNSTADAMAFGAFVLALAMLGVGFSVQRRRDGGA